MRTTKPKHTGRSGKLHARKPSAAPKAPAQAKPGPSQARRSIDVEALRQFLESIGSYAGPDLILSPGRELFHFTDLGGLLGIVQNADLWLTHLRYSNDEEELRHGQRVALEVVDGQLAQAKAKAKAKGGERRRAYLERVRALIGADIPEGVYICCFCSRDNLLSQWRGYGANGTGVSVQIDSAGLGALTGADCPHGLMRFWKVFYEAERQRRIIVSAVDFTFAQGGLLDVELLAQRAADAIQFFIPTFKNGDFIEESEWRLIFTPRPGCLVSPRFRVRGNMLVPYYSLRDLSAPPGGATPPPPPEALPIQHVSVGPSANKELNVASVRMLLDRLAYAAVPVDASKTPYRG